MERECDYKALKRVLHMLDHKGMIRGAIDAVFPVTPAPASKTEMVTSDVRPDGTFTDTKGRVIGRAYAPASEPAPTPEIPEAVYREAWAEWLRRDPDDTHRPGIYAVAIAAIAAYREHLRERPGPSDDELRAALDDYVSQFNPQCEFASRLRAVADAVKARLLGDAP